MIHIFGNYVWRCPYFMYGKHLALKKVSEWWTMTRNVWTTSRGLPPGLLFQKVRVDQFFRLDSIVSKQINPNAFDQLFPHINLGRDQGICLYIKPTGIQIQIKKNSSNGKGDNNYAWSFTERVTKTWFASIWTNNAF